MDYLCISLDINLSNNFSMSNHPFEFQYLWKFWEGTQFHGTLLANREEVSRNLFSLIWQIKLYVCKPSTSFAKSVWIVVRCSDPPLCPFLIIVILGRVFFSCMKLWDSKSCGYPLENLWEFFLSKNFFPRSVWTLMLNAIRTSSFQENISLVSFSCLKR